LHSSASHVMAKRLAQVERSRWRRQLLLVLALGAVCSFNQQLFLQQPSHQLSQRTESVQGIHKEATRLPPSRRMASFGMVASLMASADPENSFASEQTETVVLDEKELLIAESKQDIVNLATAIQKGSKMKLFVVSGTIEDYNAALPELKETLGIDSKSMVLRIGPGSSTDGNLIAIDRGKKVASKFGDQFTSAYESKLAEKFGAKAYVKENGYSQATTMVARHVAACLVLAASDKSNVECSKGLLSDDRISQILG